MADRTASGEETAEWQNREDPTQWDYMLGQWVQFLSGEGADGAWYKWTQDRLTGLRFWEKEADWEEWPTFPDEEEDEENADAAAAAQLAVVAAEQALGCVFFHVVSCCRKHHPVNPQAMAEEYQD